MRAAIIGAGSWGTALASHLCRIGHETVLWARREELRRSLETQRENRIYLPDCPLPESLRFTSDLNAAARHSQLLLAAVPSHTMREIAIRLKPDLRPGTHIISAVKGIECGSQMRMTEVLRQVLNLKESEVLALSGPSFAREVMVGEPTAIALACCDAETGGIFQKELSGGNVRLYVNTDVVGTELGGAVKNVVAIAAGVLNGLGRGTNTIAALITRGLAEMRRLAVAAGGCADTLAGLAGLGDLVLTCNGQLSRNRWVGVELGKGRRLAEILDGMTMVAEGVNTARSTLKMALSLGVEMPIVEQIHAILYQDVPPREAVMKLMERELRQEEWR